nr:helix-turn-helix transcriptional regulator [Clostridia bacterium]
PARMDVVYFTLRDGSGALYEFDPLDILLLTCTESERFSLLFAELCTRYFGMMTPRAEVKAVLQRILGALAREESSGILTDAELARLSPALEYLAQNNGDIRVAELAARCNLCEYAFRELFKKYAGMPPKAYIMHRRIEQVEELVSRSDITLTDAARACGFEDPSYFFKVYRRLRGHAPGMIYR